MLTGEQHLLSLGLEGFELLGSDCGSSGLDSPLNLHGGIKSVVGWFWHLQLAYLFGMDSEDGSVAIAVPKRLCSVESQQLVRVIAVMNQIAVLG